MDIGDLNQVDDLYEQGIWIDDLPHLPGVKLKVLGGMSPHALRQRQRLSRKHIKFDDDKQPVALDPEVEDALTDEANLRFNLLDWEGVTKGGKPLKFSEKVRDGLAANKAFLFALDIAIGRASEQQKTKAEALSKNS